MAAARKSKSKPKTPLKKTAKKTAKKAVKKKTTPKKVPPIPKGTHTITAKLCFQDAAFAIQFYEKAFGAKELYRLSEPSGKVGHAELRIGDSTFTVADEYPEMAILSAKTRGGSPIRLSLSLKSSDAAMERPIAAGCTVVRPLQNEFYGWRSGVVMEPFDYSWFITSQVEVVSPKEMQKRWLKMLTAHKPEGSVG